MIFNSVFSNEIIDLIELKRAEGFKHESEERMFKRIDSFFIENDLKEKVITKELADKWCTKNHMKKSEISRQGSLDSGY